MYMYMWYVHSALHLLSLSESTPFHCEFFLLSSTAELRIRKHILYRAHALIDYVHVHVQCTYTVHVCIWYTCTCTFGMHNIHVHVHRHIHVQASNCKDLVRRRIIQFMYMVKRLRIIFREP